MNKIELRKIYSKRRKEISLNDKENCDKSVCQKIISSNAFVNSDIVLLYSAYGSEINTDEIALCALKLGKTVGYPLCNINNETMTFRQIKDLSELNEIGAYGIKEPSVNASIISEYSNDSICIVPAIVFDRKGYRVGHGKGYYDKFLSNFIGISIGITSSEFICDEFIDFDITDISVDALVSEKEFLIINESSFDH